MKQKFQDIVRTIFHESMDSRFTEEEEIEKYIREKTEECMKIADKVEDWEEELDEYIKTNEHKFQCASWSEGLKCCLEKEWIRNFIRRLLKDAKSNSFRK